MSPIILGFIVITVLSTPLTAEPLQQQHISEERILSTHEFRALSVIEKERYLSMISEEEKYLFYQRLVDDAFKTNSKF